MHDAILPLDRAVPPLQRSWGTASCSFRSRAGQSVLETLRQAGALKVRLPRCVPSEVPLAILINTAGGLTDGDRLDFEGAVAAGARAVFTSQACERAYASRGGTARVATRLTVGSGGELAWLPQETILFQAARLERSLDIDLAADSRLLAQESVIFGRTAMRESWTEGSYGERWRVRRGGRLLHADALRISGDRACQLEGPGLMGPAAAMTSVLYLAPDAEAMTEPLRALISRLAPETARAGVSSGPGRLVVRGLAANGFALRRLVIPLLSLLRGGAELPRPWSI